jgi:Tfp pilus assembly protein PilX
MTPTPPHKHTTEQAPVNAGRFSKIVRRTRPGTSLLVALGLTTIIVLVALGVSSVVVSSIRDSANANGANAAYYAAEGAMEEGLLADANKGEGYTAAQTATSPCPTTSATTNTSCAVSAGYSISGQVKDTLKYEGSTNFKDNYGIPTPGTGNVGQNCDQINPDISENFTYDTTTGINVGGAPTTSTGKAATQYPPEDNPCNWNKIKVGETASIPLYYTDANGAAQNIFTASPAGQGFIIRIRTACPGGAQFCDTGDRPALDTTDSTKGDPSYEYTDSMTSATVYDDPTVSWEIDAQSADEKNNYVLSPYVNWQINSNGWTNNLKPQLNTSIIYKSLINSAMAGSAAPFQVLASTCLAGSPACSGVDSNNCHGSIISFLLGGSGNTCKPATGSSIQWPVVTKPVLKLSIIHSLDGADGNTIPYLEYQILTTGTPTAPTDVNQTITAEGYSGSFKQVLEVKNPQQSGLLQYVIQQ